ncbi:hypothetical protein D3C83_18410 [compost metagenome]
MQSERAETNESAGVGQLRERQVVMRCKFGTPVDEHIVGGSLSLTAARTRDQYKFLLDKQFDLQSGFLPRGVYDCDVEDALRNLVDQALRQPHLGAERELRRCMPHPQQPVEQQRIPEAQFPTHRNDCASAGRHRDLVTGPFPYLHECLRIAQELFSGGGKRRA